MRKLCPFEKVVVDLTVRSRELAGYGSLEETILAVKELRKTTSSISKAAAQVRKHRSNPNKTENSSQKLRSHMVQGSEHKSRFAIKLNTAQESRLNRHDMTLCFTTFSSRHQAMSTRSSILIS